MSFLIVTLIIFLTGLLGGLLSYFIPHHKQQFINYLLIATGSYLFSIIIRHIIPDAVEAYGSDIFIWILIGFFTQHIIQQFSEGVEHGHAHVHHHLQPHKLLLIIVGLSIHAFFEAVPLVESFSTGNDFKSMFIGIIIHKLPEAFALACLLSHNFKTTFSRFGWILLFATITPVALQIFWQYKSSAYFSTQLFGAILGIISGTLLHISTTIIFETTNAKHQIKLYKILCLILGLLTSLIL